MAVGVFMIRCLATREPLPPQVRAVGKCVRVDIVEHKIGNADICDDDLATQITPRQQQVPRLATEKSHRQLRLWCDPPNGSAVAIDAAWHVDGNAIEAAFVDRIEDIGGDAFDRPCQPGPEQGIHDQQVVNRRAQRIAI